MQKFLKRVNRGLVLLILMLVVFVIYVIADTTSFKKNKPELKSIVDAYVTEIAANAVTPEQYRKDSKTTLPKEAMDSLNDASQKLIDKYWKSAPENDFSYLYGFSKDEVASEWKHQPTSDINWHTDNGYVTKWAPYLNDSSVSIKKSGSNVATVTLSYNIVISYVGNPLVLFPTGAFDAANMGGYYYVVDGSGNMNSNVSDTETTVSLDTDLSFTLSKEDGEWKIIYADYHGWSSETVSGDDTEQSEGGEQ